MKSQPVTIYRCPECHSTELIPLWEDYNHIRGFVCKECKHSGTAKEFEYVEDYSGQLRMEI